MKTFIEKNISLIGFATLIAVVTVFTAALVTFN
jgi:hypothetical protein